jgi:hypothetical protein
MVTIAWNLLGFPLIVALPKDRTFNTKYYRDNILAALTQLQPEDEGRKFVVHANSAKFTLLKNVELFTKKMDCGSLSIYPIQLISRYPTFSVRLCQGTPQRNGVSIIRGITRRNW